MWPFLGFVFIPMPWLNMPPADTAQADPATAQADTAQADALTGTTALRNAQNVPTTAVQACLLRWL